MLWPSESNTKHDYLPSFIFVLQKNNNNSNDDDGENNNDDKSSNSKNHNNKSLIYTFRQCRSIFKKETKVETMH